MGKSPGSWPVISSMLCWWGIQQTPQTADIQGHRIQRDYLGPQTRFPAPSRNNEIDLQSPDKTPAFSDPTYLAQKVLPKILLIISGSSLHRRVMLVVPIIKSQATAELTNPTILQCPYNSRKTFAGSQSYDQALCIGGKEEKEASRLFQSFPKGKFTHSPSSSTISLIQARFTHNSPQILTCCGRFCYDLEEHQHTLLSP